MIYFVSFQGMCREIICPQLKYFSEGVCKNAPFDVISQYIYKFNIMLYPTEVILSTFPFDAIDLQNLLDKILDVTGTRDICKQFILNSVTAHFYSESLTLDYFIVEVNVPVVITERNCTGDRLANSLSSLTDDNQLSVTISVDQESVERETLNMVLAYDNRTQLLDSRQRLAPSTKTHFSEVLFETSTDSVSNIVLETPFVCPHVSLDKAEYSRLISGFSEDESYMKDQLFANRHNIVVKTFVHSHDDYDDDRIFRKYSICLEQYRLIKSKHVAKKATVMGTLSLALSCISMVCTMVIFLLFCITKRLNNGPMVLFGCALVNLFIAQGVFQFGSGWNDRPALCQSIGIGVHYFWLASVFALNAYCVLILRQIVSVNTQMCNTDLIVSLFYVYGLPAFFIIINIVYTNADTTSPTGSGYGAGQCHINTALMRGLLFAFPIFLTVVFNVVINFLIVIKIKRTQSTANNTRKDSQYVMVFFRLLVVAGLTWVFGILKEFFTSPILDYCFVVFIGGQGIFLLFSFVCRKHFYQELRKEFQSRKSGRFLSGTTSNVSDVYK